MIKKIEVNWRHTLVIWWSFIWRTLLLGALAGLVLGAIGGAIIGSMGRPDLGAPVGTILGYLGSMPISFYVLQKVLQRRYKKFSIWLVNEEPAATS